MFNVFRRDADIDVFWTLPDHSRRLLWGAPLDVLPIK
jgi:hypothetical protein